MSANGSVMARNAADEEDEYMDPEPQIALYAKDRLPAGYRYGRGMIGRCVLLDSQDRIAPVILTFEPSLSRSREQLGAMLQNLKWLKTQRFQKYIYWPWGLTEMGVEYLDRCETGSPTQQGKGPVQPAKAVRAVQNTNKGPSTSGTAAMGIPDALQCGRIEDIAIACASARNGISFEATSRSFLVTHKDKVLFYAPCVDVIQP